jgi:hypothetical protein
MPNINTPKTNGTHTHTHTHTHSHTHTHAHTHTTDFLQVEHVVSSLLCKTDTAAVASAAVAATAQAAVEISKLDVGVNVSSAVSAVRVQ